MNKLKKRVLTCALAMMMCATAFSTTAFAQSNEPVTEETPAPTIEPGEPLSEESDISTRDLLYDKATNKQFITITDRDGNVFYLVIDYDAPVGEDEEQYKTYFLNPVDTDDLKALAEEAETTPIACTCTEKCAPGAIDMDCPVCAADMTECAGKAPEPVATEEPAAVEEPEEAPKSSGMNPAVLVLLLAVLAGGGAFAYMKFFKNKPKTKGSSDLDDYDYGEEADEDGDDAPWESEDDAQEPDKENEAAEDTDD